MLLHHIERTFVGREVCPWGQEWFLAGLVNAFGRDLSQRNEFFLIWDPKLQPLRC